MRKIAIVLIFCILVALPVFATENTVEEPENKTHLSFATGVFSSRYGVGRDFGRFEVALGVDSGFPNLFVIGMVGDPSRPLETLKESLTYSHGQAPWDSGHGNDGCTPKGVLRRLWLARPARPRLMD